MSRRRRVYLSITTAAILIALVWGLIAFGVYTAIRDRPAYAPRPVGNGLTKPPDCEHLYNTDDASNCEWSACMLLPCRPRGSTRTDI